MIRFPCQAFKESRMIHSKQELLDNFEEAKSLGKSCEVCFYAYTDWENCNPVEETIVIDKVIYFGDKDKLEEIAQKKFEEGWDSTLIYDGLSYYLFVQQSFETIDELYGCDEMGAKIVKDFKKKFVFPSYVNLRTNQVSKILKRWKHECC